MRWSILKDLSRNKYLMNSQTALSNHTSCSCMVGRATNQSLCVSGVNMKVPMATLVERCRTTVLKLSPIEVRMCRRHDEAEDGYVLVAVIFMMALLVLSLSVAMPRVKQDIQRD